MTAQWILILGLCFAAIMYVFFKFGLVPGILGALAVFLLIIKRRKK